MCILENKDVTLNDVTNDLFKRLEKNEKNITRIKKFYRDENSFNDLMYRLTDKDYKRFQKFITAALNNKSRRFPHQWKIFSIIMEIAESEGTEIPPFDTWTKTFSSKSVQYYGWTFSWVHKVNTIVSIYNRENELIYQF